jgi:CCR4-NOT transcription complex subunit 1
VISNELLAILRIDSHSIPPIPENTLRRIIADSIDRSIQEILPPVVDRSVTIALITTRELVLKDFAFDPNPDKILKAADLIV